MQIYLDRNNKVRDSCLVLDGEDPRGEKMLYSGTNPESHITEHTLIYDDNF